MASDMVVALAHATAENQTLFGHNDNSPVQASPRTLVRTQGRTHATGEEIETPHLRLPQSRQTWSVLATRCGHRWGYQHGFNEHGLVVGVTSIHTKLVQPEPGLTGPDLVRLALERANSAHQAVEVVTDLIARHGQGPAQGHEDEPDAALLIADAGEAFVLEAGGHHWALTHVHSVRAASDVCLLRQDWDRLARGLSDLAIQKGWWPEDGCKLDFAGSIGKQGPAHAASLRRWGKATMFLEQHSGQIEVPLLRRLMGQLSEGLGTSGAETASSLVVQLTPHRPPLGWWCFGSPCGGLYFPVTLASELPPALAPDSDGCKLSRLMLQLQRDSAHDPRLRSGLRSTLAELQQHLDLATREFLAEIRSCPHDQVPRFATAFQTSVVERIEDALASLRWEGMPGRPPRLPAEELAGMSISDF